MNFISVKWLDIYIDGCGASGEGSQLARMANADKV